MGKAKNPSVYLDVSIGGAPAERMVFEVRLFLFLMCSAVLLLLIIIMFQLQNILFIGE